MNRTFALALLASTAVGTILSLAASAQQIVGESTNAFGLPGLIDMPTAQSLPDGVLGVSIFRAPNSQRHNFTFQITPRLTGAFRYSKVARTNGATYDRSFDLHYRLLDEGPLRPAVAIGLRDFIGTGLYSSEYIVASKTLSPDLSVTAGLGWGRLGSYGEFGAPFGERPDRSDSTGGTSHSYMWFRGDVAPFFGIAWQATDKFRLKAEYSSDAYTREVSTNGFARNSALNFGVDYQFSKSTVLSAYYIHGSEFGVQFAYAIDPRQPPFPSGVEKTPLPVRPRLSPAEEPEGWSGEWIADRAVHPGVQSAIAAALASDGMVLESMALSATRAEVRVRNQSYNVVPQAIGHTARILTRALPPSVEELVITTITNGIPTASVSFSRSDIEALENRDSALLLARTSMTDPVAGQSFGLRQTEGLYPRFTWALAPYLETSLFDPVDPFRADAKLALSMQYEFAPGLVVSGTMRQKIIGNLSTGDRLSDSDIWTAPGCTELAPPQCTHVRSDVQEYLKNSDLTLNELTFAWYARPAENLYSRLTFGYLESMYGGVSGELLWKPVESRLALGLELNYLRQRSFEQRLEFFDYEVMTGHASAYYDMGNGFIGQLDVGRYLAQDWGATLAVDRVFGNGWRVGAYATITDLSAEEYGEGAFDKGIRISIPMAWATGQPTNNTITTTIRSLTRDGGARVDVSGRLYETVRPTHAAALETGWGRFWR